MTKADLIVALASLPDNAQVLVDLGDQLTILDVVIVLGEEYDDGRVDLPFAQVVVAR